MNMLRGQPKILIYLNYEDLPQKFSDRSSKSMEKRDVYVSHIILDTVFISAAGQYFASAEFLKVR